MEEWFPETIIETLDAFRPTIDVEILDDDTVYDWQVDQELAMRSAKWQQAQQPIQVHGSLVVFSELLEVLQEPIAYWMCAHPREVLDLAEQEGFLLELSHVPAPILTADVESNLLDSLFDADRDALLQVQDENPAVVAGVQALLLADHLASLMHEAEQLIAELAAALVEMHPLLQRKLQLLAERVYAEWPEPQRCRFFQILGA